MKLTVSTKLRPVDTAIVYLLEIEVDNKRVVKIGVTAREIHERVVEILTSHFKVYRHFPYCRPKRFSATVNPYEKERKLLDLLAEYQWKPERAFQGSTELVDVDIALVVKLYSLVMEGRSDEEMEEVLLEIKANCGRSGDTSMADRGLLRPAEGVLHNGSHQYGDDNQGSDA
jgi:hypothetical protein